MNSNSASRLALLAVSCCLFSLHHAIAEGPAMRTVRDWKITLKVASSPLLPYQAVRIRCIATNPSKTTITVPYPRAWLEQWVEPEHIHRPGEEFAYRIRGSICLVDMSAPGGSRLPRGEGVLILRPGQSTSYSAALAADWFIGSPSKPPLFPKAGEYVLGYRDSMLSKGEEPQIDTLAVKVNMPVGSDKEIVEMLERDPRLRKFMMSAVLPADLDTRDKLKLLIERYPQSSYADYARFAIARSYLKGVGYMMWGLAADPSAERQRAEFYRSRLAPERAQRVGDDNHLANVVFGRLFESLGPKEKELIRSALAARKGTPEERENAVRMLLSLWKISKEDRLAAIRLLEDIKSKDFAYRPNTLVLLAIALRGVDPWAQEAYEKRLSVERRLPRLSVEALDEPGRIQKIVDELNRDFPDSLEWITERVKVTQTADEVLKYRVH